MDDRPCVNASPLIFFSKANRLDLLHATLGKVVVPRAVADELAAHGPDDPTLVSAHAAPWIEIVATPPVPAVIQSWDLGPDESAVLAYGYAHHALVVLDDLAARNCAATLGVPVRGTLGLILLAKQRNLIPAARPVVETFKASGMYLSDPVIDQALRLVDE